MHISEGILSAPVLAAGAALTIGGVVVGLRKMDYEQVPKTAVLSAAFFVASLIHLPVGPSNVHMVLNGLAGVILGWTVFPALLVALFLQAILFQFGGLTTLGVNTLNMALPAVVCGCLFSRSLTHISHRTLLFIAGFAAGACAIVLSIVLMAVSLCSTGKQFAAVGALVFFFHIPVIIVEGLVTGSIVVFLRKVRPEIFAIRVSKTSRGIQ